MDTIGDAYIVAGFIAPGADESALCSNVLAAARDMIFAVAKVSECRKAASNPGTYCGVSGETAASTQEGLNSRALGPEANGCLGCRVGIALGDIWAGTLGRLQVVNHFGSLTALVFDNIEN